MTSNRFHACATCVNFQAEKMDGKMKYHCLRLGYETKSHYQFNCWDPKEHVKKLMVQKQTKE
ncbi:hypothetical protein J7E37_13905 [Bacillus sp. ISL-39]|nr:hypothetical protein [Bacillus sp. ISL-39]MBT2639033.1 hypothetical protein [Bacillus sp. ISL-39]